MCDTLTYRDAFPNPKRGIFYQMTTLPWQSPYTPSDDSIKLMTAVKASNEALDRIMYAEYGERPQSALLRSYAEESGEIKQMQAQMLAHVVIDQYWAKWAHIWKAISAEYEPVNNYDMTETESVTLTGSETESGESSKEITGSVTHEGTETLTETETENHSGVDSNIEDVTGTDAEKIYGFNSVDGRNRKGGTGNNHKTASLTHGEQVATSGTHTNALDTTDTSASAESASISGDKSKEENTVRELKRKGNIGVTTAAQMIQGEIDLWRNYSFFADVAKDAAEALTLNIFV